MHIHCCDRMNEQLASTCDTHPDRFDCPDALLTYSDRFDEYGLIVHDGASSSILIAFCPWCGATFRESKRDRWLEELARFSLLAFPAAVG
jgi:hypothetical protein